jgi:WhiB family transcriptional regulator, redox-sensing transcriptional regulator
MSHETLAAGYDPGVFVDLDTEAEQQLAAQIQQVGTFPKAGFEPPREKSTGWRDNAACSEQYDKFFTSDGSRGTRAAKLLCMSCVVRQECLDWAIATNQKDGIWGGLGPTRRKEYRELMELMRGPGDPTVKENEPEQLAS